VQLGGRWGVKGKASLKLHYVGINESQCSELLSELGEVSCKAAAAQTWPPAHTDVGQLPDGIYHNGTAMRYFALEDIENASFAARAVQLADASSNGLALSLNYVLGHGSDIALASASETTVHPQVYKAIGVLKIELVDHMTPTSATPAYAEAVASFSMLSSELDALLPGAGSYYSEGDYTVEAFQNLYWGSNYPELLATKRKYDPDNVFTCHQCVGSEDSCARRLSARREASLLI